MGGQPAACFPVEGLDPPPGGGRQERLCTRHIFLSNIVNAAAVATESDHHASGCTPAVRSNHLQIEVVDEGRPRAALKMRESESESERDRTPGEKTRTEVRYCINQTP